MFKQKQHELQPKKNAWWSGIQLIGALAVLVTVNFALILFDPIKNVDADSLPAVRSWVWWATNDYKHQARTPDIVLLGSSALMHPTWWQEAAYRKRDVDLVVDHRSHYLEDIIEGNTSSGHRARDDGRLDLNCFNFAMPGCMASDDCIIARSLFTGSRRPKLVVIGTCPRDFVDNRFSHAASSRHYRFLSQFTDADKLVDLAMPQWWQRLDYWANTLVYFKGKAQAVQQLLTHDAKDALAPVLKTLPESPLERVSEEDRRFAMHRAEIQKGVFVAHPTSPYHYVDAVEDCFNRYKTANDAGFENQRQWFDLCLKTMRERGVEVLVVNMPVTSTALRCMRPGVYDRHVNTLKTLAAKYDFAYLDANEEYQKQSDQFDFTDWAHMNASGGAKLHKIIGTYIASNQKLVACLSNGNSSIAGNPLAGSSDQKAKAHPVAAKNKSIAAKDGEALKGGGVDAIQ